MRKPRIDGQETRGHLLEAACAVFGTKGFRAATIAEICRKANANTAAANYHFGSKEELYVESWQFAFEQSSKAYPPDGGVAPDAPVEDRLRGRILAIIKRIIDPQSHDLDIVHKEMANPTGLLTPAVQKAKEPFSQGFAAIVRELLGPEAPEQQVRLCLMSIHAQCLGPLMRERHYKMGSSGGLPPPLDSIPEDVETLSRHITCFSLAGIQAVRDHIEKERFSDAGK
ncbi:MAG: CerR family C-terminal domain-containing protein [Desulfatiglandaceae bacterium]|jgi:AcrR family transcriptional regulator